MSEALMVAVPLTTGIALATPKHSPEISILFAALGAGCGTLGIMLAREGKIEAALIADTASVIFDIFSILKALEMI